ncbi:MAG: triose-phosphate isomerase [Planctomycetota bacterium]|nr:MAG: triose-phosphate isomerase [Planctomycetota bacterium]
MHTLRDEAVSLAEGVARGIRDLDPAEVVVGVAPPFPFLEAVGRAIAGSAVLLVAQDLHPEAQGAFTGAVSGPMLASLGVERVLVGHSERRSLFGEDDACVAAKLRGALAAGLDPILCVGERLAEREAGRQEAVVAAQLDAAFADLDPAARARLLVAYEPVWAIGTGVTATPEQAGAMHAFIRSHLGPAAPPILYGGSVKPKNASDLAATPGIDGFLVGGASLDADSFLAIVEGCRAAPRSE